MVESINYYTRQGIPFLFIIDFEQQKPIVVPVEKAAGQGIYFDINGKSNFGEELNIDQVINFQKEAIPFEDYKKGFDIVQKHLRHGNSYLVNLTYPTPIQINHSLKTLFSLCDAKYKLLYKNQFLVFSPESFVKIKDRKIYSFPMKGTIDANLPNAQDRILKDAKEKAEHNTIVDLIRNDLNLVSSKVRVDSFRYIDRINTIEKDLLQVSSRISGQLEANFEAHLGELLNTLLPAGSISGAPKKKTVEIIQEAEGQERGYYTGIFGYYDNGFLDSGVMIRYIEQVEGNYFFRSGGGITVNSQVENEYQELIDKVYVPVD